MIGVRIDTSSGVVNCAMTGIMNIIGKIKKALKDAKKKSHESELERLKMMYQSMKGARNAGTHGILAAPTVTGRQFNLWGAAAITTKGQMILADTLAYLNEKHIRVVYGDTDGIYMGCSRSMGNIPEFSKSIENMLTSKEDTWITKPGVANAGSSFVVDAADLFNDGEEDVYIQSMQLTHRVEDMSGLLMGVYWKINPMSGVTWMDSPIHISGITPYTQAWRMGDGIKPFSLTPLENTYLYRRQRLGIKLTPLVVENQPVNLTLFGYLEVE